MLQRFEIHLLDLVIALSATADLVSPSVANHHKRVAYIALSLSKELELSLTERHEIIIAAMLHDIGSFSVSEREDMQEFETQRSEHAELGYRLLSEFPPFGKVADLIRHHHVYWHDGAGALQDGRPVSPGSHLIHLADRIDVLANPQEYILTQVGSICDQITANRGEMFVPEFVDSFQQLAERECFWLDCHSQWLDSRLLREVKLPALDLGYDELLSFARMLSHLIDFKSPFTSAHTAGVTATAGKLAEIANFSEGERRQMEIAGCLHDLGKLAVPAEILQKPESLNRAEMDVMRSHTYHTWRILEPIPGFEVIAGWAAWHHERLDGKGYPFHLTELPLGARIVAVADVFTAITENRPYREGMTREKAVGILSRMAESGGIDGQVCGMLADNYTEINAVREQAQIESRQLYEALMHTAS